MILEKKSLDEFNLDLSRVSMLTSAEIKKDERGILELSKKLNPATGAVDEENPDFLKTGNAAICKIKPTKPMCLENAKEIPQMGRFAIRDMGQTVAAGLCLEITEKQ